MSISATVIADSVSPAGIRLTTVQYRAPRCILAEINTHRAFTRNARSSRAVPTAKLLDKFARVVSALGGELVIKWKDTPP